MTDVYVYSDAHVNMIDVPMGMQAPSGETAYPYSVNAWRYLMRGYRATAPRGVGSGDDFKVTYGAGRTVNIAGGLGVAYHNDNPQERYSFGSFGGVSVGIPAWTGGTNYHLVTAQVLDKQIPGMTSGASRWSYRVVEGVGGVIPSAGACSIPLALVRDTGQVNVAVADVTDQREPFDNTAPSCVLTRAGTSTCTAGARRLLTWTAQSEDLYNLWVPNSSGGDSTKINIRHTGVYNLMLRVVFTGIPVNTTDFAEIGLGVNGIVGTLGAGLALQQKIPGLTWGTVCETIVLNEHLTAGSFLQAYALSSVTSVMQDFVFRLQRSEYRAT